MSAAPKSEPTAAGGKTRATGSLRRELLALLVVYMALAVPALLAGWMFGP